MPFTVTEAEKQELAVVYASLILYDDKVAVSSDNISKVLKAAKSTPSPPLLAFAFPWRPACGRVSVWVRMTP